MLVLLLGSAAMTALMLIDQHEVLRVTGTGSVRFVLALLFCAAVRHGCRNPANEGQRIVRDLSEYVAFFAMTAMIGAVASYPDAAASSGLVDAELQHADRLLHFNWVALYQFVASHRALQIAGIVAYQSIFLTPAMLLGCFAYLDRKATAYRFLLSFWLAALTTLILFRWLPAAGPFAFVPHAAISYMPQSALYQAQLIPALQHHGLRIVDPDALHGLVSAPSFHAASGTLYLLFGRKAPEVGAPLMALTIFMIAATPIEGTHYLVDVIGGVMVALAVYAATTLPIMRTFWAEERAPGSTGPAAPERERKRAC